MNDNTLFQFLDGSDISGKSTYDMWRALMNPEGTPTEFLTYMHAGPEGPAGPTGPVGEGFSLYNTYPSIAEMFLDADNVPENSFVMIASDVEDEDNSKMYVKVSTAETFKFISDLSGAQGIKGPTGATGPQGEIGPTGPTWVASISGTALVLN